LEIVHQSVQSVDTVDKVDDALLVVFLVQSLPHVVDRFAQDGGETHTHCSVGERVLMVPTVWILGNESQRATYTLAKEAGLGISFRSHASRGYSLGLTREGVLGYCYN